MHKNFWTRSKSGTLETRNLDRESRSFNFPDFWEGKYDIYNYLWWEMFGCYEFDSNGCDYERGNCQIREGDVVLDLGANIGAFAHRAEFRGASKVYSFEPIIETFECLKLNRGPKTKIFNIGVSGKSGFERFILEGDFNSMGSGRMEKNPNGSNNLIYDEYSYIVDINEVLSLDRFDFMKVDIEGCEYSLLDSITDENLSKIRCLALEFHNPEIDAIYLPQFNSRISNLGFTSFTLYRNYGLTTVTCSKNFNS
jgi:FkbM family methyltransferase